MTQLKASRYVDNLLYKDFACLMICMNFIHRFPRWTSGVIFFFILKCQSTLSICVCIYVWDTFDRLNNIDKYESIIERIHWKKVMFRFLWALSLSKQYCFRGNLNIFLSWIDWQDCHFSRGWLMDFYVNLQELSYIIRANFKPMFEKLIDSKPRGY